MSSHVLCVADAIGAWVEGLWAQRSTERERREDQRIGERALREREQVVEQQLAQADDHAPLVIEPTVVEVPASTRVARERQKPLFAELPDTRLPQRSEEHTSEL